MALREFVDAAGRRWLVWATVPVRTEAKGDFRDGWLTFDDGSERRRLAPVPDAWEAFPDDRLSLLVRVARPAREAHPYDGQDRRNDQDRRHHERRAAERRVADRRESALDPRPLALPNE